MNISVSLYFERGYIAEPYWPEREKIITIRKVSGVDRARTTEKRQKALKAYLDTHGMSIADYEALEQRAARPFVTRDDGEIVVASNQLRGLMAHAAKLAPASVRLARPDQICTVIEWDDLVTGKYKPDGFYERFIRNELTNQRRLQSSAYVQDVTASGSVTLKDPSLSTRARQFVAWAGEEIGVGAARKPGWGRFEVRDWYTR